MRKTAGFDGTFEISTESDLINLEMTKLTEFACLHFMKLLWNYALLTNKVRLMASKTVLTKASRENLNPRTRLNEEYSTELVEMISVKFMNRTRTLK